jgi:hypothetical protein
MTLNATLASRPAMADERSGDGNRTYRRGSDTLMKSMHYNLCRALRAIIV